MAWWPHILDWQQLTRASPYLCRLQFHGATNTAYPCSSCRLMILFLIGSTAMMLTMMAEHRLLWRCVYLRPYPQASRRRWCGTWLLRTITSVRISWRLYTAAHGFLLLSRLKLEILTPILIRVLFLTFPAPTKNTISLWLSTYSPAHQITSIFRSVPTNRLRINIKSISPLIHPILYISTWYPSIFWPTTEVSWHSKNNMSSMLE